jgi:flagellar protein FlaI
MGEVALFDLVKTSMRHRPDILIVGEVRGQEAYVLFQALATGHGGMCTMHAENLDSAIKRLTQKPMEISPAYIPLMNIILSIQRVHLVKASEKKAYRRVMNVSEIADYENYKGDFKWQPVKDQHVPNFDQSVLLTSISERLGTTKKELLEEIDRRKNVLHYMREQNIRSYKDVALIIAEYYSRPKVIYEKIMAGEEVTPLAVSGNR